MGTVSSSVARVCTIVGVVLTGLELPGQARQCLPMIVNKPSMAAKRMTSTKTKLRSLTVRWLLPIGLLAITGATAAVADTCNRAEFESVVATASETLRDLTAEKKPIFQDKLRNLMEKRGWTYDQFVKQAAPLVADDKVGAYDQTSSDLLSKINRMGEAGTADVGSGSAPDCKLLHDLRATMAALVATQTEKWVYLFAKVDAESAR